MRTPPTSAWRCPLTFKFTATLPKKYVKSHLTDEKTESQDWTRCWLWIYLPGSFLSTKVTSTENSFYGLVRWFNSYRYLLPDLMIWVIAPWPMLCKEDWLPQSDLTNTLVYTHTKGVFKYLYCMASLAVPTMFPLDPGLYHKNLHLTLCTTAQGSQKPPNLWMFNQALLNIMSQGFKAVINGKFLHN